MLDKLAAHDSLSELERHSALFALVGLLMNASDVLLTVGVYVGELQKCS
jgi:hypothetical protein